MNIATTHGISVLVSVQYQSDTSGNRDGYLFAYRITIQNNSDKNVQLLRRRWVITDSNGQIRTVEGEGVIGEQPVIGPNGSHTYVSGCDLKSTFGSMSGHYMMEDSSTKEVLFIEIPLFLLEVPWRLN
ncbi:MAG: Co2+/Mg2+ efflux protein ApaG [Flavobacteriales bacterium]|nr:Co2+/Mg2+ efflux protein ApaG [Flavobacteriales bacterium]MDG1779936.1 Co2+/Mg2+ efflux protein ApaG [Flavobacteriales bacterium]MDG2245746.1 Co2+/Mg2+ efflux protein ApaG [Flavobacteriales bacterium]